MKKILPLIVVAILSSLSTILIFQKFAEPIIVHQTVLEPSSSAEFVVNTTPTEKESSPHHFNKANNTGFALAAQKSTPSVVAIRSKTVIDYNLWYGERFGESSGSGVIISTDGYIVTNNHVIDKAAEINIKLDDNREFTAELIGTDPTTDLALIKVNADDLPALSFGNSDSLFIGDWVLAVGNPFRLQSTVTAGIVSAKGRNINILENQRYSIESFIQTDAVVNPGNSGGALVNTNGELIGVNTAIITHSGQYEGYSFAVPSNLVKKVVSDLKNYGSVQRGLLGIQIQPVNKQVAQDIGLEVIKGVLVLNAFPEGGAHEAGIIPGDVILSVNSTEVNSVAELQEQVGQFRPGDVIKLEYWRNGQLKQDFVTLKNQVNSTEILAVKKDGVLKDLGLEIRELSTNEQSNLRTDGIKVVSIRKGSIIDATNMIPDYIVTHVNGQSVSNTEEFIAALENTSGKVNLKGFYEKYQGDFPYSFRK